MGFYDQAFGNMANELFNGFKTAVAVGAGYTHFKNQQAQIDAAHLGNVEKLTAEQKLNDLNIEEANKQYAEAKTADKAANEKLSGIEANIGDLRGQQNEAITGATEASARYEDLSKQQREYQQDYHERTGKYGDNASIRKKQNQASADIESFNNQRQNLEKDIAAQETARSDAAEYARGTEAQLFAAGKYQQELQIKKDLLEKQLKREKSYLSKSAKKEVNNGK